jgi:hypothetical protein
LLKSQQDIADLKQELRVKEIASVKLRGDAADVKSTRTSTPKESAVKFKKSFSNLDQKGDEPVDSISVSQNIQQKEVISKKVSQEISHPTRRAKSSTSSSGKKSNSSNGSNRMPLKSSSKSPSSQTGL